MNLNTHPENRKEMVAAISERLNLPVTYKGMPSAAYEIGPLTVNRDGSILSEAEDALLAIKPMLIERGWLDAEVKQPEDLKSTTDEARVEIDRVDLTIPIAGWTVAQMTNLVRLMYSKQYLINRMLNYEMLYIDECFVQTISEAAPETPADFEARVRCALEANEIYGFKLADGNATLCTPATAVDSNRQNAYVRLWAGILKTAETATRISIRRQDDPENEKYHANSWLMRMHFGGPYYKETRRILMGHLTGFAAFKSEADMQAHREKYAQLRRQRKEE